MGKDINISVVVCTRNRPEALYMCLKSLCAQSYLPKEIIVVDDGSSSRVIDALDAFFLTQKEKCSALKVVRNSVSRGIVHSRNTGVRESSGDVVAFIDDDGFAHKEWLQTLASCFREKNVLGAGGPVVEIGRNIKGIRRKVKILACIKDGIIMTNYRIRSEDEARFLPREYVPFLQGSNMAFRRDAILRVGGFDANIGGNGYREETDLGYSVSRHGKLFFEPMAITYHSTARRGGGGCG